MGQEQHICDLNFGSRPNLGDIKGLRSTRVLGKHDDMVFNTVNYTYVPFSIKLICTAEINTAKHQGTGRPVIQPLPRYALQPLVCCSCRMKTFCATSCKKLSQQLASKKQNNGRSSWKTTFITITSKIQGKETEVHGQEEERCQKRQNKSEYTWLKTKQMQCDAELSFPLDC